MQRGYFFLALLGIMGWQSLLVMFLFVDVVEDDDVDQNEDL